MSPHWQAIYDIPSSSLKREDGGAAIICEPSDPTGEQGVGADGCFFVRLQSWDDQGRHQSIKALAGKRVRVTVEVLPEEAA